MIMIKIQDRGTALLLLVNHMHTTSKQWHCAPQIYKLSSEKRTTSHASLPGWHLSIGGVTYNL